MGLHRSVEGGKEIRTERWHFRKAICIRVTPCLKKRGERERNKTIKRKARAAGIWCCYSNNLRVLFLFFFLFYLFSRLVGATKRLRFGASASVSRAPRVERRRSTAWKAYHIWDPVLFCGVSYLKESRDREEKRKKKSSLALYDTVLFLLTPIWKKKRGWEESIGITNLYLL